MATALLISLLPAARAQQDADEKYIAIYGAVQQAESLAETGDPKEALSSLTDAQTQLQKFQKIYPDWNPDIISYRLDDLAQKIAAVNAKLAAAAVPPAETGAESPASPPQLSPQEQSLRVQLQAAQVENQTLQAKLKEALSSQPAAIDSGELVKAQEQIRSLMKENDLLKANATVEKNTNGISALRRQLGDALDKYSAEQARSQKLIMENTALQRDIKRAGGHDEGSIDLLRSQNDRLKAQLASLQAAANDAKAAGELAAKLRSANTQINSLQSTVTVVTLEKGALENKVKQLAAQLDELRAANYEGRVRDLTEQRDELAKELAGAGKKSSHKNVDTQLAALTNEMQTLRARLAVAEAKPVPYSTEELALFSQSPPQPAVARHSIHELPPGAAELVASAQRHFAKHEFSAAEADYEKILEHDQNNGLILANLATIELQEDKLAEADKHITAALVESPDDPYNLSTLGYLKFREEKYDAALDALSRAAKMDPNNPEIQNYLGVTLSHKGLRVQAETALRRAIQINPLYAPAHNNLAVVYLNQTPPMPLLARWHYQKAIAAGQPRNPDLERLLADKGAPVAAPAGAPVDAQ
ncbi:MAG TPA: tetratricopeptide repeat protein [Candidatus Acidoferrales bacterium]|nr:tetratricopeptide repeat protein [Candidatus Acidoferrales bacterium]